MKRILAILLAALLLCCVFVACDEEEKRPERPAMTTEEPTTEAPTTEEPTTEEPTTDDGEVGLTDAYVDVWNTDEDTHSAQQITSKQKGIGVVVTVPEGGYLYETSVPVASWSDNIGNLTIKIFPWNTDYDTTVAAEPVFAEEFVDFADNGNLICEFDENQIPAGRYLILVCDAVDESGSGVGVWMGDPYKSADLPEEYVKYGIESWINGKQNKKSIAKFSLVITEPEE